MSAPYSLRSFSFLTHHMHLWYLDQLIRIIVRQFLLYSWVLPQVWPAVGIPINCCTLALKTFGALTNQKHFVQWTFQHCSTRITSSPFFPIENSFNQSYMSVTNTIFITQWELLSINFPSNEPVAWELSKGLWVEYFNSFYGSKTL